MKQKNSEQTVRRALILSDGKPGHVNQSVAYARYCRLEYDLIEVSFGSRWLKGLSYIVDRCHILSAWLFDSEELLREDYAAVISAGSGTYYANRVLAESLGCKSVAIMLPKGYRLDFDVIVAQQHDDPPNRANIVQLPINLAYVEPRGLVKAEQGVRYASVIVGGDSKHAGLDPEQLRRQIANLRSQLPDCEFWLTTSRRTSSAVESMLREFTWSRAVYYSQEPINPIPDYLHLSDYVFITADSSSMISEAVSYGTSCVEVLPFAGGFSEKEKLTKMVNPLAAIGCLHIFDGKIGSAAKKINLAEMLNGVTW